MKGKIAVNGYTPEEPQSLKRSGAVTLFSRFSWKFFAVFVVIVAFGAAALPADDAGTIPTDENLVVLVSDPHIGVDAMKEGYAANNDQKLSAVIDRVLAMNPRPAQLLILGDLAYDKGTRADYELSKPILARLDAARIPWTVLFGNHDRRAPFAEVYPDRAAKTEVTGRLVTIVKTPKRDFILLDSLHEGSVGSAPDELQKKWLAETLADYQKSGKKVYVASHHPSDEAGVADVIADSPAVVGYLFGHWHRWVRPEKGPVPHFCVTSCAYRDPPLGFMTLRLGDEQDVFTLHTNDPKDENDGKTWTLDVRSPAGAASASR